MNDLDPGWILKYFQTLNNIPQFKIRHGKWFYIHFCQLLVFATFARGLRTPSTVDFMILTYSTLIPLYGDFSNKKTALRLFVIKIFNSYPSRKSLEVSSKLFP